MENAKKIEFLQKFFSYSIDDEMNKLILMGRASDIKKEYNLKIPYFIVGGQKTTGHPNEKDLPMVKRIVANITQEGDFVFDGFMGSGTTAVACQQLKRHFFGCELNKDYYGEGVIHDQEIAYEWARIPHFYNAFYVYKYATGIISAISIVKRILTEGQPAVADYFRFLSSGGCTDPVSILKQAGVDLTTDAPFQAAMEEFKNTLEEFKSLL